VIILFLSLKVNDYVFASNLHIMKKALT